MKLFSVPAEWMMTGQRLHQQGPADRKTGELNACVQKRVSHGGGISRQEGSPRPAPAVTPGAGGPPGGALDPLAGNPGWYGFVRLRPQVRSGKKNNNLAGEPVPGSLRPSWLRGGFRRGVAPGPPAPASFHAGEDGNGGRASMFMPTRYLSLCHVAFQPPVLCHRVTKQ